MCKATVGNASKTEELRGTHYGVNILPPFTSVDVMQNPCCYGEGIWRRRLFGKNTDELNDARVSDTNTPQWVRFTCVLVRAAILQSLRRQWNELEQLLLIWVAEDINEQHALVVVDPAQASANGHDNVIPPGGDVDLHVWRDLQPLNAPLTLNWRMVQQAEVDLGAETMREICHRELAALVTVAQDAHVFVQHDALLLDPVRLEELIGVGVGVAAVEARGKQSQGCR